MVFERPSHPILKSTNIVKTVSNIMLISIAYVYSMFIRLGEQHMQYILTWCYPLYYFHDVYGFKNCLCDHIETTQEGRTLVYQVLLWWLHSTWVRLMPVVCHTPGRVSPAVNGSWRHTPGRVRSAVNGSWRHTPGRVRSAVNGSWRHTPGRVRSAVNGSWWSNE